MRGLQMYGQFCMVVGSWGLSLRGVRPSSIRGGGSRGVTDIRTCHIRWKIRNDATGIPLADTPRAPQRWPAQSRGPYALGIQRHVPSSIIRRLPSGQRKRLPRGFGRHRFGEKPMVAWCAFPPKRVYWRSIGAERTSCAGNYMGGNAIE